MSRAASPALPGGEAGARRSSRWPRLALAFASTLLSLALAEGAGRVFLWSRGDDFGRVQWEPDPALGVRLRPGFEGEDDQGAPLRVNSLGLRGPEPSRAKRGPRVLVLGDSITYGFAVDEADSFAGRLPAALAREGVPGAEVHNGGANGYTSLQGALLLERLLPVLEPDVVVFSFMNNDRQDGFGQAQTEERLAEEYRAGRSRFFLYNRTALGRIAIRLKSGGWRGLMERPDSVREREVAKRTRTVPTELPPPRLATEPLPRDHEKVQRAMKALSGCASIPPLERRRVHERVAKACTARGVALVFPQFWNHPYHAEPLRAATEALEQNDPHRAYERLLAYFGTVPLPGTSGGLLCNFDALANGLLDRVYHAQGFAPEHRRYYFPRQKRSRPSLFQDLEYNRISGDVARAAGASLVSFRDLEFGDYVDDVHLSSSGHAKVAERLAAVVARALQGRGAAIPGSR